ncbi:MAG TPA: hypothetical protein VEI73_06975 [Candidatus Acidoferrum sp.]|nr:hypothetical protein [Candidatus Acidoferrum sp.]
MPTKLTFTYPFPAVLDQIYRDYEKPFGVDAKNPLFRDLVDDHSYYSMDRWHGLKLSEFCDGYIVLCAIKDMEPVSLVPDWIANEADLEEVKSILPPEDAARIKDVPSLLRYIEGETGRSQISEMKNLRGF